MHIKVKRWILVVLAMVIMLVMVLPFQSASAGSNGQQLFIRTGMPFTSVSVKGPNQNGVQSSWSGRTNLFGDAITYNYWWKGQVRVGVFGPVAWQFRNVTVPKSWNGDYTVKW